MFQEIYKAYLEGRASKDPSEFWYAGELGFFGMYFLFCICTFDIRVFSNFPPTDKYVIPLAKKLQDCGVLGVSGDEYLNYAVSNRAEWAAKGKEVVATMLEKAKKKYGIQQV